MQSFLSIKIENESALYQNSMIYSKDIMKRKAYDKFLHWRIKILKQQSKFTHSITKKEQINSASAERRKLWNET